MANRSGRWRAGIVGLMIVSGCGKKVPGQQTCLDIEKGPFDFSCQVIQGPQAQLADCTLHDCAEQGLDCHAESLFFCASGELFPQELRNQCQQLCVSGQEDCKVCGAVLDNRADHPICCGQNPTDKPVPFTKDVFRTSGGGAHVIDLGDSPVLLAVDGEQAQTNAMGAQIAYELSNCAAGVCDITFTSLRTEVPDFDLAGNHFSDVLIESSSPFTGRIDLASGLFSVPAGAVGIYIYYLIDGGLGSVYLQNAEGVVGFASVGANAFLLTGTATDSVDGHPVAVTLSLAGSYSDKGPPVPSLAPAQTFECTSPAGAVVPLDASASSDPDNDPLRFFWYEHSLQIAGGASPSVLLSLGAHDLTLDVLDDLSTTTATTHIEIRDTRAPTITASVSPECLWPPNHKLVRLSLGTEIVASTTDACDATAEAVRVVGVTSNDTTATADDMRFGQHGVCLRAERPGGADRIYTIELESNDASGNVASRTLNVTVQPNNSIHCPKTDRALVVDDNDPACSNTGLSAVAPLGGTAAARAIGGFQ